MITRSETILIVEDDAQIRNFISYVLQQEGFPHLSAGTAEKCTIVACDESGGSGSFGFGTSGLRWDGCDLKKIREWSEIPIIVVSARDQDHEKAAALDTGADDYLTKPFSTTELMARIRVALRHLKKTGTESGQAVRTVGGLSIDLEKRLVYLDGAEIHVTPLEYNLLTLIF